MENNLDNDYIDNAIEELVKLLGIKDNYSFYDSFSEMLSSGQIEKAIQLVATYLRLPIKIQLSYASDKYNPQEEAEFQSSNLTKTDHAGKGIGGITAQVYIPSYLPPFGSQALQNYPIKVKVSKDCAKHPHTLIAVIVHELSHILLASLGFRHKDSEIYTDLTPMVLGFSNIVREGRMTTEDKSTYGVFSSTTSTTTTTYGYLTDDQFVYALDKINSMQKKCTSLKKKVLKESISYTKLVHAYERQYFLFNTYLEYIDGHFNQKIDKKDGSVLINLHQQLYKDTIETAMKTIKSKLKHFDEKIDTSFNAVMFQDNLETVSSELKEAKLKVQSEIKEIKDNLKILKKYVRISYRLKLYLSK